MNTDTILQQLEESAAAQAQALDLSETHYALIDVAHILGISRALLYRLINNPRVGVDCIRFPNNRGRFLLPDDIRKLYVLLHTPYIEPPKVDESSHAAPVHEIVPAPQRPSVARMLTVSPRTGS